MKTQLAYEIHDPAACLTPDSTADFTPVWVEEIGSDRVQVGGATGRPRPDTLKVLVGVDDGWKVRTEALGGGVSRSLRADSHGKSYQSLILDIDVDADDKIKR